VSAIVATKSKQPSAGKAPSPSKRGAPKKAATKVAAKKTTPKKKAPKLERVTRTQVADARQRARLTFAKLRVIYPDAHCELDHADPYQLLVSVVLSAQTTDVLVNKVTPKLFATYPDVRALAAAEPTEVATLLRDGGLGMFNNKAKNIVGLARLVVKDHGGQVPRTLAELVELPGVGRKTANVVLGVAFNTPEGVVVDTHVMRLAQRIGWAKGTDPVEIEQELVALFPREDWDMLSHVLIFHGRRCCFALKPACSSCGISADCPSAFRAETIGRKSLGGRGT
jgi:endonuclease-3